MPTPADTLLRWVRANKLDDENSCAHLVHENGITLVMIQTAKCKLEI